MPTNPMPPEQARALVAELRVFVDEGIAGGSAPSESMIAMHEAAGLAVPRARLRALCDLAEAGLRDGEELAKYDDADRHYRDAFGFTVEEWRNASEEQRAVWRTVVHDQATYAVRAAHTQEEG